MYPHGTPSSDLSSYLNGTFRPADVVVGLIDNKSALDVATFTNTLGIQISAIQNFVNTTRLGTITYPVETVYTNNIVNYGNLIVGSLLLSSNPTVQSVLQSSTGLKIISMSGADFTTVIGSKIKLSNEPMNPSSSDTYLTLSTIGLSFTSSVTSDGTITADVLNLTADLNLNLNSTTMDINIDSGRHIILTAVNKIDLTATTSMTLTAPIINIPGTNQYHEMKINEDSINLYFHAASGHQLENTLSIFTESGSGTISSTHSLILSCATVNITGNLSFDNLPTSDAGIFIAGYLFAGSDGFVRVTDGTPNTAVNLNSTTTLDLTATTGMTLTSSIIDLNAPIINIGTSQSVAEQINIGCLTLGSLPSSEIAITNSTGLTLNNMSGFGACTVSAIGLVAVYTSPNPMISPQSITITTTSMIFTGDSDVNINVSQLPTADPHSAGQLWNSSGIVHVSAG